MKNDLTVGFIPLVDCACLVAAHEQGFAREEGLELRLVREFSWANIRDRLIVGQFDAAHMLGPMTVATTLGIRHVEVPLAAPFALGLGGNAITVSTALRTAMRSREGELPQSPGAASAARVAGEALGRVVAARESAGNPPLTFAVVYPFSCHNYELRYWLAACGIVPDRDVRIVVIPPPLLADAMRAGHVDGFCAGEPWNSVAVEAGVGSIALATTAIWSHSPEKVLGCRADWAARHHDELSALIRSLHRASLWCADPANRVDLAQLLARPGYVGAPASMLERTLDNRLVLDRGGPAVKIDGFHEAVEHAATFPWVSHALWFYSQMVRWGQTGWSEAHVASVRTTYRPDLYRAALAPLGADMPAVDWRTEDGGQARMPSTKGTLLLGDSGFFDGRKFDPRELHAYTASFPIPSATD